MGEVYNVYPSDLVIRKTYVWKMGAENLDCIYVGRGLKPFTYKFRLLGEACHTLSYENVYRWIDRKLPS